MLKKRITWILAIYAFLIFILVVFTPKTVNWTDSFRADNKSPYGSYILNNELDQIFDTTAISDQSLYNINDGGISGNYIIITNDLRFSQDEINELLAWIGEGNNALVSAQYFPRKLLDTLNLGDDNLFFQFDFGYTNNDSKVRFIASDSLSEKEFIYDRELDGNYMYNLHDSLASSESLSIVETEDSTYSILMERQIGYGSIYMHSLPRAFSNYYMLKDDNFNYASAVLSKLPNVKTTWNEYYKPVSIHNEPKMKLFMSQASFKWALYLGLSLIFIYILFKLKRSQRIIPILNPPENRSLEFTKTIGDLYFNTNDGKDLSIKMERHFKEFIKEKYFVFDFKGSDEDLQKLADKSGKNITLLEEINGYFNKIKEQNLTNSELIQLNQQLHKFYYGGK